MFGTHRILAEPICAEGHFGQTRVARQFDGDILRQFLVEAILLSGLGGIVGIGLGIGASAGLTTVINSLTSGSKWPIIVSFPAAIVALLFAGAVGLFFGFYPARRASKLDPIEALRYE